MSPLTIADAEKVYQRDTVARTAFNRFPKAILQELCKKREISVVNTGLRSHEPTKPDYINALLFFLLGGMTQMVDIVMSSVEPSMRKEAEREFTNAIDVEMEPEWLLQAEGGALAVSSSLPLDEPEIPLFPFPSVCIRLYKDAQAWHYLCEILFHRDLEGNINLHELRLELAVDGELQVLEPRRHRPFFNYTPGILHADDVDALLADGFLQVTDGAAHPKTLLRCR
ncbi:hypothetical protein K443DRAFT_106124 [Laccaria amethystina LaAM-08-1]|uniref:Uncharacterized protein n=1 Tax=Laccaria amethystina LaAM-08-1 TaxID=1095629 RepID=A0A0C9XLZ4_9AGAR|nr:hypothetical protein K443DRAFT_106124 [Laccaria amethystina LaAM-08-1]